MPARATVSSQNEMSKMRLAASRSHRSPRMDRVVKAFAVKEEVRRGSVGIKVGLICEQQCDLYVHLSPRTSVGHCAPEIIMTKQVAASRSFVRAAYRRKCRPNESSPVARGSEHYYGVAPLLMSLKDAGCGMPIEDFTALLAEAPTTEN